jgi:anti-sigma factor RsiW
MGHAMSTPPSSYEMLVAYADGQLDRADRELMLTLLDMDAELNREVWELRKVKDMIEVSYQELEPPRGAGRAVSVRHWLRRLALGAALMALGYLLASAF